MAGFRSLAYQVRDARNDRALRRHSLRRCLERFAPYGHRATWWHLCDRHGIAPEDRAADPQRLVAALEELEEARAVWLEYERQFAERRRREKYHGLRRPEWAWGGSGDAVVRCADPGVRPDGTLGEVLRRLVVALESEPGTGCPVCGEQELRWPRAAAGAETGAPRGARPLGGGVGLGRAGVRGLRDRRAQAGAGGLVCDGGPGFGGGGMSLRGPGVSVSVSVSVSVNGARTAADGTAVPLSPQELVESALGAVAAGAGEVLVHPRTPCGRESLSPRVVGPVLEALRGTGVSVPLSVSVGIAAEPDPAGRLERVRSWTVLPDRAVVHFAEPGAEELAEALLARGVGVDAVVPLGGGAGTGTGPEPWTEWGPGLASEREPEARPDRQPEPLARFLAWPVRDPARLRLALELAAADPALVAGLRWLPPVPLLLFGRDAAAWPVLRLAARCGAAARTGVGDVLHLPDGRAARSNAELVAAAREVVAAQGAATAWSR